MFSLMGSRQYSKDLLQTHNEVYTCFSLFNKRESLKEHMSSVSKGQSCDDEQRTERVTHSFFDNFLTDLSQYYCYDTVPYVHEVGYLPLKNIRAYSYDYIAK